MKIKKTDLQDLIVLYLNEQMSLPTGVASTESPKQTYPEEVVTDQQKRAYDVLMTAKRRAMDHPESEAGLAALFSSFDLRFPQDFVIFENAFQQHIENWKLFKRVHPNAAFLLQLLDMSGVASYGDLAESIENMSKPNPTVYDKVVYGLNIFSSLPIGLLFALGAGRFGVKAVNTATAMVQKGELNLLNVLKEFMKASPNFGDIIKPKTLRLFFKKPQTIQALEKAGITLTDELIETCIEGLFKFFKFIDSFGFRAFMRTYIVIAKNFSENVRDLIIEWVASEAGQEYLKTSELAKWLLEISPKEVAREVTDFISSGDISKLDTPI